MNDPSRLSERLSGVARWNLVAVVAGTLALCASFGADGPGRTLHRDGKAVGRAAVAVSRGLLHEDVETVRKALEELGQASPALKFEDQEIFGRDIYDADRALQQTLVRAREYATQGIVTKMFDEFVWVQRTCLNCHEISRKQGLLPEGGPIGQAEPER